MDTRIIRQLCRKAPSEKRFEHVEECYRPELMDEEERQELRERVLALRRRLGR